MNTPKDYLTDRVAEFRIQFCEEVKNIHDEGTHLEVKQINSPDKLESFLTETIEQSMEVGENKILDLYSQVMLFAHKNNQVVGEKRNYYITLEQLEAFIKSLSPKL